jgi:hypothetical protein
MPTGRLDEDAYDVPLLARLQLEATRMVDGACVPIR